MSVIDFMLSTRQQRMLGALLLNPEKEFRTNELLSIGGPGVGAGRNIIRAFEKSDIVVKSPRGNQILYSINSKNPIYNDLRSICLKTFGLKDVVECALRPFGDHIELAFIFGSIVKGAERASSDVDLMVVGNVGIFEMGEAVHKLEEVLGREIDLQLHTSEEWKQLAGDRVIGAIMRGEKIMVLGE
jgi:uncharacterized protein